MTTAFNAVVSAMVAALQAATPVSAQIHRARIKPLAENWPSAVVVRLQDAELDRLAIRGAPINADTTIAVECYARSTSASPDVAVDALLASVYARLAADPTLGGLVSDCQATGVVWEFDTGEDRVACATVTYLVRHRTQALTLE